MPANTPGRPFAIRLAEEGDALIGIQMNDTFLWNSDKQMWEIGQSGGLPSGIGPVGTFLISDGTNANWGSDITPQNFTTSGEVRINNAAPVLRLGLAPGSGPGSAASQGNLRWDNDFEAWARNSADTGDIRIFDYDAAGPTFQIGQGTAPLSASFLISNTEAQMRNGTNYTIKTQTNLLICNAGVNQQFEGNFEVRGVLRSGGGAVGFSGIWHGSDVSDSTGTGGKSTLRGGNATNGAGGTGGDATLLVGTGVTANGNLSLVTEAANYQSMRAGIFIGNRSAAPTADPANGGFLTSVAGALTWRGSGGTITTMGPA